MTAFLIQVSGHLVREKADREYVQRTQGRRYCDEPIRYHQYFNASPYWKEEGYGRKRAWQNISAGDSGLLYCTSSVDEHGACLSHLLTVDEVTVDEEEGARLTFSDVKELVPKITYGEIQDEISSGCFSNQMSYCGQEGFNIALLPDSDVECALDFSDPTSPSTDSATSHPDDSLDSIAEEYLGDQ